MGVHCSVGCAPQMWTGLSPRMDSCCRSSLIEAPEQEAVRWKQGVDGVQLGTAAKYCAPQV